MPTPDEIRESELGDKAKILGCCLRRSPSSDVWAADYGCFLVYETPDCSGEFRRFENLDQVEDFLLKRNGPTPESPADQGFEAMLIPPPLAEGESQKSIGRKVFPHIAATQSSLLREAFSDSRNSILTALVAIEGMSLR